MKAMKKMLIGALLMFDAASLVQGSCKSGENYPITLDYNNQNDRQFSYNAAQRIATDSYATDTVTIVTHNIQSGLSLNCNSGSNYFANLERQADVFKEAHYCSYQEVDVNTVHCGCNQPQDFANITGKDMRYLRTIYYAGGMYGHASGTVYDILETRYQLYSHYTTELRGLLAQRTRPPQLGGDRDMWIVSTHFQYDSVQTRTQTAIELVQYVQNLAKEFPKAAFIVPGDYYVNFGDPDYAELTSYFTDAYYQLSGVRTGGSTYPSNNPTNRFDYVFYRAPADGLEMKPISYAVFNDQSSDHAPVRVDFAFPTLHTTQTVLPNPYGSFQGTTTGGPTFSSSGSGTTGGSSTPAPTSAPTPAPTSAPTTPATNAPTSTPTSAPTPAPTTPAPTSAPGNGGSGGCTATYKLVERPGSSYESDGKTYTIVDIVIVNTGSCTLTSATVEVPMKSGITQSWNYNPTSGAVTLYGVGAHSQYSGAGFIYVSSASYTTTPNSFAYDCMMCGGASVSGNGPSASPQPTGAQCGANLEVTARSGSGSTWTNGDEKCAIYDMTVSANGDKAISAISFTLTSSAKPTSSWNIDTTSTPDVYSYNFFGNQLKPGHVFSTAGWIVCSSNPLSGGNTAFLYSATC